ncbi:MAG: hypothetical protein AAF330_03410 [Pseudomonadota bacterium]
MSKKRWMDAVIKQSENAEQVEMPWARGSAREGLIKSLKNEKAAHRQAA